jgi:hypothetical protein
MVISIVHPALTPVDWVIYIEARASVIKPPRVVQSGFNLGAKTEPETISAARMNGCFRTDSR